MEALGPLSSLLRLFYPPLCRLCGAPAGNCGLLCPTCLEAAARPLRAPFCRVCAEPLPMAAGLHDDSPRACGRCLALPPPFVRARAFGVYEGALREMLHGFKFRRDAALGRRLAAWAAAEGMRASLHREAACVTFVPSHWSRRMRRGAEPVRELARWTASRMGLPLRKLLRRRKRRPPQVGLPWRERERNMRGGVFAPLPPRGLAMRHAPMPESVVLFDDVLTTGATARACARALRRGGVKEVRVLTLARTPRFPSTQDASAAGRESFAALSELGL